MSRPDPPSTFTPTDLARRVVGLMNLYRLLVPLALLLVLYLTEAAPTVGRSSPRLFVSLCILYFAIGIVMVLAQRRPWRSLRLMALTHGVVDSVAIAALLYASGGVASGLGILLVLPVGAAALLVEAGDAFLIAAVASIGILVQQILAHIAGHADMFAYPTAGVLGGILFLIALGAWPLARRLRETEALVKRQEVDLANLAQLSQYIFQHLRESLLVVDPEDRIRLINESAAQLLGDRQAFPGALLGEASPRLLLLLTNWRRAAHLGSATDTTGSFVAADGSREIVPHFAPLGSSEPAPVLIFLEDP
ncbi:MAG: PAS domain-containing protein, partial [Gammaproteobacteria bacterium]|nr:PAS domain-containing protein [Gammaproteobacteria bacterium]